MPDKKKLTTRCASPSAGGDMDAMGHVNNTVYFRYLETLRIGGSAASARPIRRHRAGDHQRVLRFIPPAGGTRASPGPHHYTFITRRHGPARSTPRDAGARRPPAVYASQAGHRGVALSGYRCRTRIAQPTNAEQRMHQLGRGRAHLAHQPGAVDVHRARADDEPLADELAGQPRSAAPRSRVRAR